MTLFSGLAFVIAPLIVSNVLHMFIVKFDLFQWAKIPLSKSLFGKNKSYRAFLFLPPLNAVAQVAFASLFENPTTLSPLLFGALSGLVYLIAELPNSYVKRRQGIPPGAAGSTFSWVLIDKADSALAICLLLTIVGRFGLTEIGLILIAGVSINLLVSAFLVKIGIKASL